MKTFADKQFTADYNRLMLITFCVVLVIAFALIGIQVKNQSRQDDAQLVAQFKTRSIAIDNLVAGVAEHLNLMHSKAESHFLDPARGTSRLFDALADSTPQQYGLDRIPAPYTEADVGNLTGDGSVLRLPPSTAEELEMALSLNSLFQGIQRNIPNAAWTYYTSEQKFINIYPWVHSARARFTDALYLKPFYQLGLPANNPGRTIRWTPLYVDDYGKGMMVTATKPIDRDARFLGTVSIDITLDEFTTYVRDFVEAAGELMIVNEAGELIAHPTATSSKDTQVRLFKDHVPPQLRAAADQLLQVGQLLPTRFENHVYVWYGLKHAPWKVVFVAAEPNLLVKTLSKAGLVFIVLLGALTAMLVSMRMLTFRQFIDPADSLVRHIVMERDNKASAVARVPPQWLPWFGEVSRAFEQNRRLIDEINQKNQQLTDMNISLERYTPQFILLVSLGGGCGGTTVGSLFADTLARKDASKATVYLEYPNPEKLALDLGLAAGQQCFRHPNGYDIWTSYDLGQVPQAGVTPLLMAKVLHKYNNVVINATAPDPAEDFIDRQLEPMFRHAKAIFVVIAPDRSADPAVRQLVRQIKKCVRQDHANVYLLANRMHQGGPAGGGADFEIPFIAGNPRLTTARYECPGEASGVIGKLVDRVERVHQISAFIPTTIGVDKPTDTRDVMQRTLTYFSQRFGGATSSQADGAWNSDASGVVSEMVYLVVSYTTEEDLSLHVDDVIDFIKQIKAELGQEAMAIGINRKLILV